METVLGPLLQTVFDKLLSPIVKELQSRGEYAKELKKLEELLPTLQAVIADAEERQVRDERVRIWLKKLRRVAYDADDIFDQIQASTQPFRQEEDVNQEEDEEAYVLRKRRQLRDLAEREYYYRGFWHQARQMLMNYEVWFGPLKRFTFYCSNYRRIKEIRERLDDIVKEMNSFGFREDVVYRRYETAERRQTGPYLDDSVVYGREEDVKTVVEMLLSGNDFVIPIVAMGVIGKTTLAQLAYNDPSVERNFSVRIWISVYDNFNVRKIINDILDYTSKGTRTRHDLSQLGLLQVQLQDSLQGNRYLIVLDDVWNEDQAEWEKLRIPLERCGSNGSKILVTTRSRSVASIMSTMPPYLLQPLTNEDCWALFKRHAFGEGEEQLFPSLVSIGKEMVNTCGGVPLAAKILGSMMRSKRDKVEWLDVQRSSAEELGDSPISRALRLSYNHLPPHLKRCFSYLSVFPKKYELEKEKLIEQWIALGLVPSRTNANECFNDLMLMSFFHEITRYDDIDDGTTKFKLHDLIHDVAVSVAGDEVLRITDSSSYVGDTSYARHASLECKFHSTRNKKALFSGRKLRTIHLLRVSPEGANDGHITDQITSHQRWLRVLNLSGCGIGSLHNSIGGLILLKYLDLSGTPIVILPEAICGLCNLETLNLSGCNYLKQLPWRITRLIKLRHLNIRDCASLTHMPPLIRNLSRLETLSMFITGRWFAQDLRNLFHLQLGGELKIKCLENVEVIHPVKYLAHMKLHSLGLSWGIENEGKLDRRSSSRGTAERNPGQNEEDVLARLEPNLNLRRLSMSGYAGTVFPPWMNHDILSNLTKLDLINCRRCENLPTLGKLPLLKVLKMEGMGDVVKISGEFYGNVELNQPPFFQSLIELNLEDFPELRAWESMDGAVAFPCLNRLKLTKCPRLLSLPRFPSLQHLDVEECNELILRSAAELNSLFTVVINKFPELSFINKALLQNNSRMTSLTLISCPCITSLPATLGNLTVLESLTIRFCEALVTLPDELRNLTSLQTLEIAQCGSLTSLPEKGMEGLISLRSFSIENCNNLTCLPRAMEHLEVLEHLTVMYCPNLDHLPDGLQHISTLRSLSIISCPELVSLPEGLRHVKMLQNLELRDCGKLTELPEWVGKFESLRSLAISECPNLKLLPQGFQNLKALQHLSIGDCPDLESRCQTERGEDWHKVSHIPHRYIGSSSLQQRQGGATSSSI